MQCLIQRMQQWQDLVGGRYIMSYLMVMASAAGGIILREVMNYFGIELFSAKGIVTCIVVGIVYVAVLNRICEERSE